MADSHVLSGLVSKRQELSGEVGQLLSKVKTIKADVDVLDAAIKIIDPSYDLRKLKPKKSRSKNAFFEHGESTRFVLDSLRCSNAPLSTVELADQAARMKGLDTTKIDYKALKACVLTTLSRQRIRGVVVEVGRATDGTIEWELSS